MKKLFFTSIVFVAVEIVTQAQNVGIGTTNPSEKLEVNGGIKIGTTTNTAKGTIRWNETKNDFEGYNGAAWVSLTGGKGTWGNQFTYALPDDASEIYLQDNTWGSEYGRHLGESLAMHNNIMVAGASYDYTIFGLYPNSGNVYLLSKTTTGWAYKNFIRNPTPENSEHFGVSSGVHNNNIIIGANSAQVNGSRKGEVNIYTYDSALNTISSPVTLTANDGAEYDNYGISVGIYGDYAVVGATGKSIAGFTACGAAYIYKKNAGVWSHFGFLSPAERNHEDIFGYKVSISSNWIAVSATGADVNGTNGAGKVYLYQVNAAGTAFVYHSTLTAPAPMPGGKFGHSLFIGGDTLIVGEMQYTGVDATEGTGKVYVYVRSGNSWNLQGTLSPADGQNGDAFGFSVHYNNGKIVVGAPYATVNGVLSRGKAYVFELVNGNWLQQAILSSGQNGFQDFFGHAVAIGDDNTVISAKQEDFLGRNNHGRLYYFKR
jgi:hypothetical protein